MLTNFSVSMRKIVTAGRAIGTLDTKVFPKVPIRLGENAAILTHREIHEM